MKILLITAHPNPNSTSHQFAEIALQEFEAKGHKVELIHLYQEKALQFGYLQFTQGQKIPSNDQELRQSWQERVRRANKIIFFFPTWWNDFPAVLKSWFENVIIGGFAYRYVNGKPQGMLRDKHLQIFATCDAPGWIYTWLPVPMWVNWRMRTHLSKIKLDGVKVFGNMHARKKSKTKMACLFADFRKRMQKMAGK